MSNNRQNDLSFHIRIPANKAFTKNVLLTLDGICDHFSFTESSRDRIKKALETALVSSVEKFYQNEKGLFDLQFLIYKNKLMISIEDFLLDSSNQSEEIESNNEEVRNMLKVIEEQVDGISFSSKKGRNACYSISFNVSFISDNI